MSEAEAAAPTEPATSEPVAATPVAAEKKIPTVRTSIANLTKENFASTLADIEPFLLTKAGVSFYAKSLKRINRAAKVLGATVPANYGKDAKATAKRRGKQDAFVKAKIEEVAAAAVEAAEAKAAAAAAPAEESSEGAEEEAP